MANITKDLALKIADKLSAVIVPRPRGPHDLAQIYSDEGMLVASFGIRRSPRKDKGHDHIPRDLHITAHEARELGLCSWYRPDYLRALSERGYCARQE